MATLFAAQVCGSTGHSIILAVGSPGRAGLVMGLMGALGSAAGGMILGVWGFAVLNAVGGALVLAPLAITLLRRPVLVPLSQMGG